MLIELDLNNNDAQALLRHCAEHRPNQGDFRENARLGEALETLAAAIEDAMNSTGTGQSSDTVNQELFDAAVGWLGDEELAISWLSRPLGALGHRRPIDVSIEDALAMIARLEHGFGA